MKSFFIEKNLSGLLHHLIYPEPSEVFLWWGGVGEGGSLSKNVDDKKLKKKLAKTS